MDTKKEKKKKTYTATQRKARYIGDHPHIASTEGTEGYYYYHTKQKAYVFRPEGEGKNDWYRVWKENIIDLEETT